MDCSPPGSSVHGDSSGKNTEVGCHALLQEIFPTQGSNPDLPHCRQILYHLSYQGNPSWFSVSMSSFLGSWLSYNYCCPIAKLCPTLCDPMDCNPPGSSVQRFPREEYWSELPFPSPGDLSHSGIKPMSPARAGKFFTAEPPGKPFL